MEVKENKEGISFKTFAEAMPQMAFIGDSEGNIIYYNQRWYDYIGNIGDTKGWKWMKKEIHHPEDAESTIAKWKRSLETGAPYEVEYRLRRHDGEYRWHLGRANPIYNNKGEIDIWLGTNTDIHEQKLAEEALRESEEKYRSVFETIDQGFCIMDMIFDEQNNPIDYRFLEINPTFSAQTGLKDAKGKTVRELVPDLEDRWFQIYGKVALTGEAIYFQERSIAMDRWFDIHAFKIGGDDSKKVAILFTDITQKRKAEEEKNEAQKMLQIALSAGSIDVWVWDLMKNKLISNELLANLFSLDPSDVSNEGLPLEEFVNAIHPDDRKRVLNEVEKSVQYGDPYDTEYRLVNKNGEINWVIARGKVEFNNIGKAIRFQGVLVDITERKKAEEALNKREEEFRTLADNMSQLAWMTDENGDIYWYNKRWFDYTGTNLEDVVGRKWQRFHHPDHLQRVNEKYFQSIKAGETWEDIFPLLGKDGNYRWFLSRAIPIKDNSGKIIHWFGTNTDITQIREVEEQLNFKNSLFEAQQEVSPLGILVVSPDGKILSYNKRFIDIWKLPENLEMIHSDDDAIKIVKDQLLYPEVFVNKVKESYKLNHHNQEKLHFKDGRIIDRYGSPVIGEEGINYGYVWFFLDITEQENLAKQKDEFIGIASHELKTPLTIVKAYMQLLQMQIKEPMLKSYMDKTQEYVNKLDALINDLFDVSKILAGKLQFKFSDLHIEELLNETIESVTQIYTSHKIIREGNSGDTIVYGDKTRLEQVLINLFSNAIKYSPEEEKIIVTVKQEDEEVVISVTDFGIGIPKHEQAKLFDRFYRIDDESGQFSGLGMGLYIVSEIIERHKGKVWIDSEVGKGSTFHVSLPVKQRT